VISTGDMKKTAEASASGKTVIDVKNNILAITNISPRKNAILVWRFLKYASPF